MITDPANIVSKLGCSLITNHTQTGPSIVSSRKKRLTSAAVINLGAIVTKTKGIATHIIHIRGIKIMSFPTNSKFFTKKNAKKKVEPKKGCPENPFTNYLDSFIFCNDTINIKVPKDAYMIQNGKKRFAYAVGMFPNPKTGEPAYLDGCILAWLGLKRQRTNADVICFITHDISKRVKKKLLEVAHVTLQALFNKSASSNPLFNAKFFATTEYT